MKVFRVRILGSPLSLRYFDCREGLPKCVYSAKRSETCLLSKCWEMLAKILHIEVPLPPQLRTSLLEQDQRFTWHSILFPAVSASETPTKFTTPALCLWHLALPCLLSAESMQLLRPALITASNHFLSPLLALSYPILFHSTHQEVCWPGRNAKKRAVTTRELLLLFHPVAPMGQGRYMCTPSPTIYTTPVFLAALFFLRLNACGPQGRVGHRKQVKPLPAQGKMHYLCMPLRMCRMLLCSFMEVPVELTLV